MPIKETLLKNEKQNQNQQNKKGVSMLEHEKKIKVYQIKNLHEHINKFINIQESEATKENYNILLENFYNYAMENELKEINLTNATNIIKEYKANLYNNSSLASSSINNYILRLQSFFNYLGFPTRIKKLNINSSSKPYKYLTKKEIDLLIKTIPETNKNKELQARNKAIINLLFCGGLRVKELINLTKKDFQEINGIYYINVNGKGKAKDIKELLAIPETTSKDIINYLELRKKRQSNYLFVGIKNEQLTRQGVNKMLKTLAKKTDKEYNLNITPRCSSHAFRHSLARYLLIDKATPLNQVKDILRHSKIETTAKYLTTSYEEIQEIRINLLN